MAVLRSFDVRSIRGTLLDYCLLERSYDGFKGCFIGGNECVDERCTFYGYDEMGRFSEYYIQFPPSYNFVVTRAVGAMGVVPLVLLYLVNDEFLGDISTPFFLSRSLLGILSRVGVLKCFDLEEKESGVSYTSLLFFFFFSELNRRQLIYI